MLNIIKKSMLTGIGLALIAKDEVEDLAKELVNKGKMSESEGTKFLEDLQKRYDETQKMLEEKVQRAVKDFMKKADVVTGDELKGLKKEIRDLKKQSAKEEIPPSKVAPVVAKRTCRQCRVAEIYPPLGDPDLSGLTC